MEKAFEDRAEAVDDRVLYFEFAFGGAESHGLI